MSEHRREYETAEAAGGSNLRLVKLPGEKAHSKRGETARTIAKRLAIAKAEKRLKTLNG